MLYAGFSPLGIGQIWHFDSDLAASFWGAIVAFLADAVVTVGVSLVTTPKPTEELRGLVWGLDRKEKDRSRGQRGEGGWWRSPALLGGVALAGTVVLNLLFL
jgi:SSS family solute:Na+ symporter